MGLSIKYYNSENMSSEVVATSAPIIPTVWVSTQGITRNVEKIMGIDFDAFKKKCLPAWIPEIFDNVSQEKFIAIPFDQTHALSGSYSDKAQTNLILANDGTLWVLLYPYTVEFQKTIESLSNAKVLVVDEYWSKDNPFYPVSRVFVGYENT